MLPCFRFAGEAHEETFRLQGRAEQQVMNKDMGMGNPHPHPHWGYIRRVNQSEQEYSIVTTQVWTG